MIPSIKVPNVNIWLLGTLKKHTHFNILLPIKIYCEAEGTPSSACSPGHTMHSRQAVMRRLCMPWSGLLLNQ